MLGKPTDYLWTLLVGGLIGVVAQAAISLFRLLGLSASWSVTAMLAAMALFGTVMTVLGFYGKWEKKTAIGAYMPFSGAAAYAIECTSAAFDRGEDFPRALWSGIRSLVYLYGMGILACMIFSVFIFCNPMD